MGLIPSNTGESGGKRTGDLMSHYIASGGSFDTMAKQLMTQQFTIAWMDRFPPNDAIITRIINKAISIRPLVKSIKNLPSVSSLMEVETDLQEPVNTPLSIDILRDIGVNIASEVETFFINNPDASMLSKPQLINKSNQIKYICTGCNMQVWGKPNLRIKCEDYDQSLKDENTLYYIAANYSENNI